jgi:hypothetical protein
VEQRAEGADSAVWAALRIAACEAVEEGLPGVGAGLLGPCRSGCQEELPGAGQEASPADVCLKTEVADADEAMWQDVKQEAADEVWCGQGERPARVVAPAVAVAKGDLAVLVGQDALVADGDAMGVAPEVTQQLCRAGHGSLAVDDPFLGGSLSQQVLPEVWSDGCRFLLQGAFEELEQLASEHPGEDAHRDQKARACGDPAILRSVEAATGDDAMEVGVKEEGLGPGMQHGDRARRRSEPALAHGMERPDGRLEEQRVARAPISQEERVERGRHREDQVKVGHREELILLCLDPVCLFQVLALGAMPVPAGVVEGFLAATAVTHLEVAAHERRSTRDDSSDHSTALTPELVGRRRMRSENLREIRRAARSGRHRLARLGLAQGIQRAARQLQVVARHVGVTLRGAQAAMAQE